jgi:hypothetical protein
LTVQGALTINGSVKIFPNGLIIEDSSPSAPLTVNNGLFDGKDRFVFNSGGLNGTGSFSFTYVNFTGNALKTINATTTVSNLLYIDPGVGQQSPINIVSKQLIVAGNLSTSQSFNIYSNPGGSLNVTGSFVFQGASAASSIIRGDAVIASLVSTGGTITLNDNVTVAQANIGPGAILSLIGSGSSTRYIGNIFGQGTLQVQGGTNTFGTFSGINTVNFQGGTITSNSNSATINNLVENGGTLTGSASITISTLTLTNAQISGPSISVISLTVQGFTSLANAKLTLTGTGVIGKDSQFTLSNGAQFIVTSAAKVSQSAAFQLLPSGSSQPPSFTNNGIWTTSPGNLNLLVNTLGNGSFQLGTSSTLNLNGIAFNTQRLTLEGSTFVVTGATVATINTIGGTGFITASGKQLSIGSILAQNFTQTNGFTQIGTGTINNFTITIGSVNITGASLNIGNLTFVGGTIAGNNRNGAALSIGNTTLIGNDPKTFVDITARSQDIELSCGTQQCQLFTQNALLTTKGSKRRNNVNPEIIN